MLGLKRSTKELCWYTEGKHPCAKDFIIIGEAFPLAKNFSHWVERGFLQECLQRSQSYEPVSWRFWTKGGDSSSIACGIIRDSSDSLGRPYPFLVIEHGPANGWDKRWDSIPSFLQETWMSMDGATSGKIATLDALKSYMKDGLRHWKECSNPSVNESDSQRVECLSSVLDHEAIQQRFNIPLRQDQDLYVITFNETEFSQGDLIPITHLAMNKITNKMPNAVFIGGLTAAPRIIFFFRPMKQSDFGMLWSNNTGKESGAVP